MNNRESKTITMLNNLLLDSLLEAAMGLSEADDNCLRAATEERKRSAESTRMRAIIRLKSCADAVNAMRAK